MLDDDESGTSGSDYGQAMQAKQAARRKKAERGHEASDTESEDAHVDRELSGEAASEHDDSPPCKRRPKAAKKGIRIHKNADTDDEETVDGAEARKHHSKVTKQCARTGDDNANRGNEERAGDGDEEDANEGDGRWIKTPGPLSKAARAEAQEFALKVTREAERIARKYKKSTRDVMLAAGLGVRTSRSKNPFNMFKKWYAHHNPKGSRESKNLLALRLPLIP